VLCAILVGVIEVAMARDRHTVARVAKASGTHHARAGVESIFSLLVRSDGRLRCGASRCTKSSAISDVLCQALRAQLRRSRRAQREVD
jgi:hypothetical protein